MKKKLIGAMVTVSVLTIVLAGCDVGEKTKYERLYEQSEKAQQEKLEEELRQDK